MNLRVFFYIYLFIYFVVVCVCVCVAFFALTLWYILLSFPFYSIRWFIHVIVHVSQSLVDLEHEDTVHVLATSSKVKVFPPKN